MAWLRLRNIMSINPVRLPPVSIQLSAGLIELPNVFYKSFTLWWLLLASLGKQKYKNTLFVRSKGVTPHFSLPPTLHAPLRPPAPSQFSFFFFLTANGAYAD